MCRYKFYFYFLLREIKHFRIHSDVKIRSNTDTPKKSPRYPPALLSTQGKSQTWYSSLKYLFLTLGDLRTENNGYGKFYLSSCLRLVYMMEIAEAHSSGLPYSNGGTLRVKCNLTFVIIDR